MKDMYRRVATGLGLSLGALGLFVLPHWLFTITILGLLLRILVIEWPRLIPQDDILFWSLAPFYPVLPILLVIYLQLTGYEMLNLMLFSVVGAHDTGAYFAGKRWGATPINPDISPGKTWEGFAGGVTLSLLFALIFFVHNPVTILVGSVLPLVISINFAALAGDLFESSLKRRAGRKDAGSLLPGHGGVLDRVDGILFAVFIVFIARNWLKLLLP